MLYSRKTVFGFRWLPTFPSQNAACRLDIGFGNFLLHAFQFPRHEFVQCT